MVDATLLTQDVLLDQLDMVEFVNKDRLPQVNHWTITDDPREFLQHQLSGDPCIDAYGVFILGYIKQIT